MAKIDVSFQIEVDDEQLKEYGLSLDDVVGSMYLKNDSYSDGVTLSSGIEQCDVMMDYKDCFSNVSFQEHNEKNILNKQFNKENFDRTRQVLIDNGIDKDDVDDVLQAVGYTLLDTELFPDDDNNEPDNESTTVIKRRNELLQELAKLDGGQIDFSKFDMNFLRGANKEFEIVCNWDEIANYVEGYYPELIEDFDKIDEATKNDYAERIYEHILESDYVNTLTCEEKNEFIGDEIMSLIKDEIESIKNSNVNEQDRNAIAAEVDKGNKDNISREDR